MSVQVEKVKYFVTGKITEKGEVEGIKELSEEKLPIAHGKYYFDEFDRVCKLEIFDTQVPNRPTTRTYHYADPSSRAVVYSKWYDRHGNLEGVHSYEYENGLMLKREEHDPNNKFVQRITSKHDERGRLIEERWYRRDESLGGVYVYGYREDSVDEASEHIYDENEEFTGHFEYDYNERANLSKKEWFDRTGKLRSFYTYEYDEEDRLIKITLHDADEGIILNSQEYTLDEAGNKAAEVWKDGNGFVVKRINY